VVSLPENANLIDGKNYMQFTLRSFFSGGQKCAFPATSPATVGAALVSTADDAETAWSPAAACLLPDVLPVAGTLLSYGGNRQLAAGGTVTHGGALVTTSSGLSCEVDPVNWRFRLSTSGTSRMDLDQYSLRLVDSALILWSNTGNNVNTTKLLGLCKNDTTNYLQINNGTEGSLNGLECGAITATKVAVTSTTGIGGCQFYDASGTQNSGVQIDGTTTLIWRNSTVAFSTSSAGPCIWSNNGLRFASSGYGGTPAVFIRSGGTDVLAIRNNADSADAALTCGAVTASGLLIVDSICSSSTVHSSRYVFLTNSAMYPGTLNLGLGTSGNPWGASYVDSLKVTGNVGINRAVSSTVPLVIQTNATSSDGIYLYNNAGTLVSDFGVTGGGHLRWRFKDSSATNVVTINADGVSDGLITLNCPMASSKGLFVKGTTSQTANLIECQNVAGAVGAKVTATLDFSNAGGQTFAEIFGAGATVSGPNAVAVGANSSAGGAAIAIGYGTTAAGGSSVAVGTGASSSASGSVAIGNTASGGIHGVSVGMQAATGTYAVAIGTYASASHTAAIAIGRSAITTAANQLVVGATGGFEVTNSFFGNGVTAASPSAHIMNATGGSGTNIAGANFTIAAGRGTGTGLGGSFKVQVAPVGSTGSTANALADALVIDSTKLATFSGAITASGAIQETPTQSSLNPTTTNIPSGKRMGWYNTALGEFRDWVNIGGTLLKSAAYT
jgi:hypothetical protein